MKKTGISALATAVAVSLGCLAAFPAVQADAADERASTVIEITPKINASIDFGDNEDDSWVNWIAIGGSNWSDGTVFDVYEDQCRKEIISCIEERAGAEISDFSVIDFKVGYEFSSSCSSFGIYSTSGGFDESGQYVDIDSGKEGESSFNVNYSESSGIGFITPPSTSTLKSYNFLNTNFGAWGNSSDTASLKVTSIVLSVEYDVIESDNYFTDKIPYSYLYGNEFIKLGCIKPSVTECGHQNHISSDGVDYTPNAKFCPWTSVDITRIDANGNELGGMYTVYSATSEDTGDIIYSTISLKDIYAQTGTPSEGEYLMLRTPKYAEYSLIAKQPDMQLGTLSINDFVVEEAMDYDPATGNYTKTGKPDLRKEEYILNGGGISLPFEGYKALVVDYTLRNPDDCSAVLIVLHGWGDGHVGWEEMYFPIDGSGKVVVDLSKYQSLKFYNIYAGVSAKASAKIGDKVTPGFTITNAALVTEYSGSFSKAISAVQPEDPTTPVNPSNPTNPSIPSIPSIPSTPSTPTNNNNNSSKKDDTKDDTKNDTKNEENTKPADSVSDAKPNTTVSISISTDSTNISSNIFLEAKEKNLTMELKLPNGVTWTIKAGTISDDVKNIDINVDIKTNNIPKDSVNEIAQGNDSMQISLSHNGSFGFNAEVSIPVGSKYNGKYANAYHYNKGIMEFIGSAMVAKGEAPLNLVHASEYAIVFSDEPMAVTEDISSAAGIAEESTAESSANGFIPAAAVIITVFAAVKTVRRIREK